MKRIIIRTLEKAGFLVEESPTQRVHFTFKQKMMSYITINLLLMLLSFFLLAGNFIRVAWY